MAAVKSIAERFWSKVDKRGPDDCWPWTGSRKARGYGMLSIGRTTRPAHVISWELANGTAFPAGHYGCHRCDNPPCVNPAHVWPGTPRANTQDMVAKGRGVLPAVHRRGKPQYRIGGVCQRGHVLSADTIAVRSNGRNACRVCLRALDARKNAKRQGKPVPALLPRMAESS